MGCTQSKIENEEAVTRCKERKLFMKEAVAARNAFAAAHFAYAMSLKNTGAALSDYAHGEVQNHGVSTPGGVPQAPAPNSSFVEIKPPPPPPESLTGASYGSPPLQRAVSMPEMKLPPKSKQSEATATIFEEEDEDGEIEANERLVRKSRSHKGGSRGGSSRGGAGRRELEEEERAAAPPVVEARAMQAPSNQDSSWGEYLFSPMDTVPGPTLADVDEPRLEKAELERKAFEETPKRVDGEEKKWEEVVVEQKAAAMETERPAEKAVVGAGKGTKKGTKVGASSGDKRVVKSNLNLLQIFVELDDHFLKASESAHDVSKMLEATRLHYHSNFADNRGHIDHSARVMRVITWNRSFRGLVNNDDGKDEFDSEENETHATVLDKLLAWEKKLYDEVKAGELMKIEYQKKVAMLSKLKKRGTNSEALEKAKAAVSHLHTRYIVDMQSMDSTVSEINRLRDEQLYPKLVQLVDGMAKMWETMQAQHESQARIAAALKTLDFSQSPKETSEHHHERTIQLWSVVQEWHSQFCKLVDYQKQYIKALNCWLKLNLIPIESNLKEKVSSPPRVQSPPIQRLLLAWNQHMEKLTDELARTAIHNFAAVINTIMQHQDDEMKLKERCEETRNELNKKTRQFEDWYNKYIQRRTPDELDPERTEDSTHNDAVVERKLVVEALTKRLEEEEEAYRRTCTQVREKSLASLKTRLPELFRAMLDVALAFSEMYSDLRSRSQHNDRSQSTS